MTTTQTDTLTTRFQDLIETMLEEGHSPDAITAAATRLVQPSPLMAAFHAIYDVKDGMIPGSGPFEDAAIAIRTLETVMRHMAVPVPTRFDRWV